MFIFYGLDEALFYGHNEEGIKFPTRDANGITHLEGEIQILGKESQMEVYNTLLLLLKMVGSRPLVLIMPYHRWIQNPCCSNKSHTTNGGTNH